MQISKFQESVPRIDRIREIQERGGGGERWGGRKEARESVQSLFENNLRTLLTLETDENHDILRQHIKCLEQDRSLYLSKKQKSCYCLANLLIIRFIELRGGHKRCVEVLSSVYDWLLIATGSLWWDKCKRKERSNV